jgi:hypothetical protein
VDHDRSEWFATLFNVEAPRFDHPEDVIVVLAADEPMSYVIPFFQPQVRFVSLSNNFTRPGRKPPEALRRMLDLIESHEGPLFALLPSRFPNVLPDRIGFLTDEGTPLGTPREPAGGAVYPPPSDVWIWPIEVVPPGTPAMQHRRLRQLDR